MRPVSHRAGWVMKAPGLWIENGVVTEAEGKIVSVEAMGSRRPEGDLVDHGSGVLMPCLVNAHTHITLSSLKGKTLLHQGFVAWVWSLIETKAETPILEAVEKAEEAARGLREDGVGLVGEFGPSFPVERILEEAGLEGTVWQEFLGADRPVDASLKGGRGITSSLAGHAPHTTDPRLLRRLKGICAAKGLPFCIHLAESKEELSFLLGKKGPWGKFLSSRGIDYSDWDCFGKRPVELAQELGLLDGGTLLVHLLWVNEEETELISRSGAKVCLCPRSNFRLHGKLPRIPEFLKAGIRPCLGTDSLASVDTLSMWDEMNFLARAYPQLSPTEILEMTTLNGAYALGREDLGSLEPGRKAKMIYVELEARASLEVEEALVESRPTAVKPVGWWVTTPEDR